MAAGHLVAGYIDPVTDPANQAGLADLVLNWGLPAALIAFAIKRTELLGNAPRDRTEPPAPSRQQPPDTHQPHETSTRRRATT